MKLGRRLLGRRLFERLMKMSFYGQFVAGEDVARIRPLVQRNMSFGVRSILDYSVEKDISREEARAAELAYVILLEALFYIITASMNVCILTVEFRTGNKETYSGETAHCFVLFKTPYNNHESSKLK